MFQVRYLFFLFLFTGFQTYGQVGIDSGLLNRTDTAVTDSIAPIPDTSIAPIIPPVIRNDSVSRRPQAETGWRLQNPGFDKQRLPFDILQHHPWMGFATKPDTIRSDLRIYKGKETVFYLMLSLLLIFAILRTAFPKYFSDLFRLFFRTTLKQRQIREQLMQTPLPSLLLNGFFVLTAGIYLAFVLEYYEKNPLDNVWLLALYCCVGIAIMYLVKFIGLRLIGMIFGMQQAANSYIFVVFIINKMIGILLLPFLILLAFTSGNLYLIALNLSFVLLWVMLVYRLILTFAAIRNQIKVNPFHFLLYICAFEVAPLLLVYRGLLLYFPEMA